MSCQVKGLITGWPSRSFRIRQKSGSRQSAGNNTLSQPGAIPARFLSGPARPQCDDINAARRAMARR